jgi:hypothetical protein
VSFDRWKEERIGYLNIDCEGHDLEVLKGFDLARYQPSIITRRAGKMRNRKIGTLRRNGARR